ncbi:hypothetical protein [Acetobacter aceti]|uniref:hypothetical protein n=1 Tax=Acetobacter aceti TaxID=435 RepID=UPI001A9DDDEC|nr:hypothetical protein [Acetobacter aceti]
MILLRDLCYRARTIAASMAIGQTEAIGGASFRAAAQRRTAGRNFLDARGMTAQPSGEENYGPQLRHSRSRRSRPPARSAILRGSMRARPDRAHITETMATRAPRKCRLRRGRLRHARFPPLHTARSGTAPHRTCRASPLQSACGQSERQSGCLNRRTVSGSARRLRASPLLVPRLSMT